MFTPQNDLKTLIRQLKERGSSKEQRLHACHEITNLISGISSLQELGNWEDVLVDVCSLIPPKGGNLEVKKACGAVAAAVGSLLASDGSSSFSRFLEWIKKAFDGCHIRAEEERAIYICSLRDAMKDALERKSNALDEANVQEVMKTVCSLLDQNNSQLVLIALFDVCLVISQWYPDIFDKHFEEVADFAIGWFVDEPLNSVVTDGCRMLIQNTEYFWKKNANFALHLLEAFLEDIGAFVLDTVDANVNGFPSRKYLLKSQSILNVLNTILLLFVEFDQGHSVVSTVVSKAVTSCIANENLLAAHSIITTNEADFFAVYCKIFINAASIHNSIGIDVISQCNDLVLNILNKYKSSPTAFREIVKYFTKVYSTTSLPSAVTLPLVDRLFNDIRLFELRNIRSESLNALCDLLISMLPSQSLPILQATYSEMVKIMQNDIEVMKNAQSSGIWITKEYEIRLITCLRALNKLAAIKSSLIVMMGMRPSLFHLLLYELPSSEQWFISSYPSAHITLIHVLIVHVKAHDYFLSNSDWFSDNNRNPAIGEALSCKYAQHQVETLVKLFSLDITWKMTRDSLVDWLDGMVNSLDDQQMNMLIGRKEWRELKNLLVELFLRREYRSNMLRLVSRLKVFDADSDKSAVKLTEHVIRKIRNSDSGEGSCLWNDVDMRIFLRCCVSSSGWDLLEVSQQRIQTSSFGSEDFLLLSDFLLNRVAISYRRNPRKDDDWLKDTINQMYDQCHSQGRKAEPKQTDIITKWQWALAQMAIYCIENKMKTPLGKPIDTFSSFENELRRCAKEAILGVVSNTSADIATNEETKAESNNSKKNVRDDDDDSEMLENRPLSCAEEWWRVRCLLEFVNILEKLINNCNRGTSFAIYTASQPARQFFVTNYNSCHEWLVRIYPSAMVIAYYNGYYAQVIKLGTAALADLEKKQILADSKPVGSSEDADEDMNSSSGAQSVSGGGPPSSFWVILCWTARAMAELGAEQAVQGLYQWTMKIYKIQISWLLPVQHMAAARFESALVEFRKCLDTSNVHESLKPLIRHMMLDVLSRLRLPLLVDYNCPSEVSIWSEAERLGSQNPAGVDAEELIRVRQLSLMNITSGPHQREYKRSSSLLKSTLHREIQMVESDMMQTLRWTDVTAMREELSTVARHILLADGGQKLHARIAAVGLVTSAVLKKMEKKPHEVILGELSIDFLLNEDDESDIGERLRIARQLCLWTERLTGGAPPHTHLSIAKLARKTCNMMLCGTHLVKATSSPGPHLPLTNLCASMQKAKMLSSDSVISIETHSQDVVDLFLKLAHMYEIDSHSRDMMEMEDFTNGFGEMMSQNSLNSPEASFAPSASARLQPHPAVGDAMARSALHLAHFFEQCPELESCIPHDVMASRLWVHLHSTRQEVRCDIAGSVLILATQLAPHLAKAHKRLGDWTYQLAECEVATFEKTSFDEQYSLLLGKSLATRPVLDSLWTAVTSANTKLHLEEMVHAQLSAKDVVNLRILLPGSRYLSLWNQIRHRRCVYYQQAVHSYFLFISEQKTSNGKDKIGIVSTTLRILGLLVKHFDFLHQSIDDGLKTTNEHLWKDILPQLFARLSHPVPEVRSTIVGILSRLCISAPHAVVFQVVSGASSSMLVDGSDDDVVVVEKDDENASNVAAVEKDDSSNKERCLMFECCRQLELFLDSNYPRLVKDVRQFIDELQRINLLNEERWVFVLANLDHEMTKRLEQIKIESEKTYSAQHLDEKTKLELIAEKGALITTSVYRILRDLYERTCLREGPVTPNEATFIETYGEQLRMAFEQSKNNGKNPEKAWMPFKSMLKLFQQRTARRGGQQVLQMEDISLVLTNLSKSSVPIPGQEDRDYLQVVTLDKIGKQALVLPTKTRPKKMTFIGNDGKEQMFLFKGQEDLHLDERIMQLLHICNLMLTGGWASRCWPSYTARHYAVTPLGARSGLIQWVHGATPMFHIYRKWQIREAQLKANKERKSGIAAAHDSDRPTDLYQRKLRAVFAQNNVDNKLLLDRSKWPTALLKDVLLALLKDTPKDLLYRELCIRAASGDTWWRVICRLSRSCAVMSMIGAILGLGDRHLDNLLVDLDKGTVIHIDYNICFDKGKNLRVPETVPFRLTQNMVNAMGPTQIEGTFRESCIHVLKSLQIGQEVLTTMLEAFVYDPLVDWTATDHLTSTSAAVGVAVSLAVYGTDSRAAGAKPVARQMFAVRIKENGAPWMKNCTELKLALILVTEILEKQSAEVSFDQERIDAGRRLKTAIAHHHHMMKDFRPLLKALATCDERFNMYLDTYRKKFSDPLVKGHSLLDGDLTNIPACIVQFGIVVDNIEWIYKALLSLESKDGKMSEQQHVEKNDNVPPGFEDLQHVPKQQEQNAHARNLVRRVNRRLQGYTDSTDKISTPREQADYLIRQATSTSLLSLMYEGWTAWV